MKYALMVQGKKNYDLLQKFFKSIDARLVLQSRGWACTLEEYLSEETRPQQKDYWLYESESFEKRDKQYFEHTRHSSFDEFDGKIELQRGYVYRTFNGEPGSIIIKSDGKFTPREALGRFEQRIKNFSEVFFSDMDSDPDLYNTFIKRSWWSSREKVSHLELTHALVIPSLNRLLQLSPLDYYKGKVFRNPSRLEKEVFDD